MLLALDKACEGVSCEFSCKYEHELTNSHVKEKMYGRTIEGPDQVLGDSRKSVSCEVCYLRDFNLNITVTS